MKSAVVYDILPTSYVIIGCDITITSAMFGIVEKFPCKLLQQPAGQYRDI